MTFKKRQFILLLLFLSCSIFFIIGMTAYESEAVPFVVYAAMFLIGGILFIAAIAYMWLKMRCPHCKKPYPSEGWSEIEYCPYCGKPYDD